MKSKVLLIEDDLDFAESVEHVLKEDDIFLLGPKRIQNRKYTP